MLELMAIVFGILVIVTGICVIGAYLCLIMVDTDDNYWKLMVVLCIIAISCGYTAYNMNEPVDNYITVFSLGDQLGVHGSFVLGGGTVDSEVVYIGLINHGNGIYEQIIIRCRGSIYLIEEDSLKDTGYIKWTEGKYTNSKQYRPAYNIEIHVPKGTIIKNFNINGE